MGLLDGGLQRVVSGVFGGLLLDGYLHRADVDRTARGGKMSIGWESRIPIKIVDTDVTERMVKAEGATAADVQLIILQIDANGEVIDPPITSKDEATLIRLGVEYRFALSMIGTDPAKGAYFMRARPTNAKPEP